MLSACAPYEPSGTVYGGPVIDTSANPFDRLDTNRDGFLSRAEAEFLFRSGVGGTDGSYGGTVYGPR